MKKLLSILLAVVMMFSISIIAFAADSTPIELDKEYTVTLKNDTATYTFTAPEDGAYRLSASIKFKEIFQILKMMIFSWQKKAAIWAFPSK